MMNSNKKSRSLLGLLLALALVVGCLATTAMAASFNKETPTVDVDSRPITDLCQTETGTPKNNCESGPQDIDSPAATLRSVNRNDRDKFSEEEWEGILEQVETGAILFFETLEDEIAYFHHQQTIK